MDIFTLALYVILIGLTATMAYKLAKAKWYEYVEKRRLRRLGTVHRSQFQTKHGQRTGRRR